MRMTQKESPFIEIGFGNFVNAQRVIAVVGAEASPVRRMIQEAKDRSAVIDASSGKKTRAVLIMDSDHIVMSAMTPEALLAQLGEATDDC